MRNKTKFQIIFLSVFVFMGYGVLYANTDNEPKSVNETNEATVTLNIVANSASSYSIVYGAAGGTVAKNNATQLAAAIKAKTGCMLATKTDATAAGTYEIVLGPSNTRSECIAMNATLGKFGYNIAISGKKLVITATDANHMVVALKRFETAILKSTTLAGTGFLNFGTANTQYGNFLQTQASLRSIITNGYAYKFALTLVCSVPAEGTIKVAQGACTDGTYVYFVNRNSGDTQSIVYKYSASTWKKVSQTAAFNGGHSNDVVYDALNNRVIVLRGGTNPDIKSETVVINPSTMKTTTAVTIPTGATAIDYNKKLNQYAVRYGSPLYILNDDFTTYKTGKRTDGCTMTSQGMGADEDYFYFPMSPNNGESYNSIPVYDWNLNYIKTLTIPSSKESEGLFEINGIYYVNFYQSGDGARLYRIDVTLNYTSGI